MTKNLQQFLASIESADREWANSFDLAALERLTADESDYVRQILLSRLDINDRRIPGALTLLADAEVVAALERKLPESDGWMQIATADALLTIQGPREDTTAAIRQGVDNPDFLIADEALNSAARLGRPALEFLVPAMANHPEKIIRTGAAMAALFVAGINDSPLSWDHRDIVTGLASQDREERQKAFDALCEIMEIRSEIEVP